MALSPPPVTLAGTLTNARMKTYLYKETVQVSNADIFRRSPYYEDENGNPPGRAYDVPSKGNGADPERSLEESQRRARSAVQDIALCNRFTHMFTWTLSPDLIDRYDAKAVYKKIRAFLSNATQRKGFRYVCIPELHNDGAIHFHGLCSLGDVEIVQSIRKNGTLRRDGKGRLVFNMTAWTWGFSTCVELDENYERAVNYVCKYITKSDSKVFGKWYLSSRSIKKRPDIYALEPIPYDDYKHDLVTAGIAVKESTVFRDVKVISTDYQLSVDTTLTKLSTVSGDG